MLTPKKGWDFTTYDIGAEPFQVRTWYGLALKYIVLNPPKDTPRTDISLRASADEIVKALSASAQLRGEELDKD